MYFFGNEHLIWPCNSHDDMLYICGRLWLKSLTEQCVFLHLNRKSTQSIHVATLETHAAASRSLMFLTDYTSSFASSLEHLTSTSLYSTTPFPQVSLDSHSFNMCLFLELLMQYLPSSTLSWYFHFWYISFGQNYCQAVLVGSSHYLQEISGTVWIKTSARCQEL